MDKKIIRLKQGKEKPILEKHHWVFSGAIEEISSDIAAGDVVSVLSYDYTHLGYGYFNPKTSIAVRMLNFCEENFLQTLEQNICNAHLLRKTLYDEKISNAYRWIHAEADCMPGLIVDRYGDTIVMQIATLGMEKLKKNLIEIFSSYDFVKTIYEKSLSPSRSMEGLSPLEKLLMGEISKEIVIRENSLSFSVDIQEGQKTGFFLDQKEMRKWLLDFAKDKNILNAFGYTGAFSIYALAGHAKSVTTLDSSQKALELAKKNVELNGFSQNHQIIEADYFDFVERIPSLAEFDLVILDPPAFVKKQKDLAKARKLYEVLNEKTLKKMKKGSFLLTCSCSYFLHEDLFIRTIAQAAKNSGRFLKLLSFHRQSYDHPINLYHLETDYLKSLLLYVQ